MLIFNSHTVGTICAGHNILNGQIFGNMYLQMGREESPYCDTDKIAK
jgi:hypothetical protein